VRSSEPPRYRRESTGSKLDPFNEEIRRLLRADPRLPGTRVRELIAELGCEASKTIVDDHLREVRPWICPGAPTGGRSTGLGSWCSSTCSSLERR
jgi:hypothetical protein